MNQKQFDHAVRAAGSILGENVIMVIGSQAVFGTITTNLPKEAERSVEIDFVALNDEQSKNQTSLMDQLVNYPCFTTHLDTMLKEFQNQQPFCQ